MFWSLQDVKPKPEIKLESSKAVSSSQDDLYNTIDLTSKSILERAVKRTFSSVCLFLLQAMEIYVALNALNFLSDECHYISIHDNLYKLMLTKHKKFTRRQKFLLCDLLQLASKMRSKMLQSQAPVSREELIEKFKQCCCLIKKNKKLYKGECDFKQEKRETELDGKEGEPRRYRNIGIDLTWSVKSSVYFKQAVREFQSLKSFLSGDLSVSDCKRIEDGFWLLEVATAIEFVTSLDLGWGILFSEKNGLCFCAVRHHTCYEYKADATGTKHFYDHAEILRNMRDGDQHAQLSSKKVIAGNQADVCNSYGIMWSQFLLPSFKDITDRLRDKVRARFQSDKNSMKSVTARDYSRVELII